MNTKLLAFIIPYWVHNMPRFLSIYLSTQFGKCFIAALITQYSFSFWCMSIYLHILCFSHVRFHDQSLVIWSLSSDLVDLLDLVICGHGVFQDSRIVPNAKYIDGEDSVGHYITLNPSEASRFWIPDVFIDQAKDLRVPTYYTQPASIRIYNDSTIRYSSRQAPNTK